MEIKEMLTITSPPCFMSFVLFLCYKLTVNKQIAVIHCEDVASVFLIPACLWYIERYLRDAQFR